MDKEIVRAGGDMTRKKLAYMFAAICDDYSKLPEDKAEEEDEARTDRPYDALDPWEHYPEVTPTHMSFF